MGQTVSKRTLEEIMRLRASASVAGGERTAAGVLEIIGAPGPGQRIEVLGIHLAADNLANANQVLAYLQPDGDSAKYFALVSAPTSSSGVLNVTPDSAPWALPENTALDLVTSGTFVTTTIYYTILYTIADV